MLLNKLIPQELKEDSKVHRSTRLIIAIDLVLFICSIVFIGFFWWIDFVPGVWIMVYTAFNSLLFLGLMYYTQNFLLCGNFFSVQSWIVFTTLIVFSGGTDSPFLMWLLSIPPIGLFYMRNTYAYFWLGLCVLTVLALSIAQMAGVTFTQHIDAAYRPPIVLFNYLALLSLFLTVVMSFKKGYYKITHTLKKTNKKLQNSNSDLERFAYIASHDLKSPLRNVVSFMDLFMRRNHDNIPAESKEYLDIAKSNAMHMQNLIEDILEYSQSSNAKLKEEEVSLNRVVKLICDQLKTNPSFKKSEIMVWNLPTVIADTTRMHQLFQNIIENGLKYNQSPTPTVAVQYQEDNKEHYFIIEDNGIGIPEEYHKKVFKMFERLHTRQSYKGTGIGLAICLKNVQEYGGNIVIDSEEGRGTQFHIRIPKKNLPEVKSSALALETTN